MLRARHAVLVLFGFVCLLLQHACGRRVQSPPGSERAASARPAAGATQRRAPARSFRAVTFNAGLAVGLLPHTAERGPRVADGLANIDADVVCVQEVWLDEHWRQITDAGGSRLMRTLRPPPELGPSSGCSAAELERALDCVRKECKDQASSLALCAGSRCGALAGSLSGECIACLTQDPLRSLEEIERACLKPEGERTAKAKPPAQRPGYAYGGSHGLGLLTQSDVIEHDFLSLPSEKIARGVIYAKLGAPEPIRELNVFCTHLSAESAVPYPRAGGSWRNENKAQLETVLGWIDERAPRGRPALLLGDLNTGPASEPDIEARFPDHYARIVAQGFLNPYLDARNPPCTFCFGNPVVKSSRRGGLVIDHALLRDVPLKVRAERVLTEPIELDANGRQIVSAYSDHYGVMAAIGISDS